MKKYDAIVLGTGGIGSAALFHLSKQLDNVLGLDRFPGGHDRGSSHGETRIIRQAYFEHPDYVPLLIRAYELWHELETLRASQLFFQVGLLEIGPTNGMLTNGIQNAASQHQLVVDSISRNELDKRFPGYHLPEGNEALFEPKAGYLLVEECILAHLAHAEKLGAEIRTGEEVSSWSVDDAGLVTVITDRQTYLTDRLIITSGAWAGDLLSGIDLKLRVVRKHLHWYACDENSSYHEKQGGPAFFYETEEGCFYGFPMRDARGVKLAEHTSGETIDNPLELDCSIDINDQKRVEQFLSVHLPEVKLKQTDHSVCMYTLSPDENFIIDKHPDYSQVIFAAGMSGHGFKFASVLGEILSQLTCDGKTKWNIDFLKYGRN
jgi:sarcosine oxidase